MKTDLEKGIELAIQACRKLVKECDEAGCCDLCGGTNDLDCGTDADVNHDEHCPYVTAKKALQLLGIKE